MFGKRTPGEGSAPQPAAPRAPAPAPAAPTMARPQQAERHHHAPSLVANARLVGIATAERTVGRTVRDHRDARWCDVVKVLQQPHRVLRHDHDP